MTTTGRQAISPRIIRVFNLFGLNDLTGEQVQSLFSALTLHFLQNFTGTIKNLMAQLIASTHSMFLRVQESLLPTPSKSFYVFTIKDIWRLFLRMVSCDASYVSSADQFLLLYHHEALRVFQDRLISATERRLVRDALRDNVFANIETPINSAP
jgi:dynein heavy chain